MRAVTLRAALAACVVLAGCVVDELTFVGRACSDSDPCGGGLVCQAGRCAQRDGAAGEARPDAADAGDGAPTDLLGDVRVDPPPPGTHVSAGGWGQR
ncbi:MAG: hypothetical protein KC503_43540, partial [Myxococcales bacterium]|nr:hypothetical protein [Myxococcales bacterium]